MLTITIDHQTTTVPEGATVLEAARKLGIEIPTLCFLDDIHDFPQLQCDSSHKSTSCLVCLVKWEGRMVPACATRVLDRMIIESESEEVRALRRTALELLLSDHLGDCIAPCVFACPAKMDVPGMLRSIKNGDMQNAIRIVKERIALPAALGRVCPRPCEKACRRKNVDFPVAICELKRFAADTDLGDESMEIPPCAPPSGKRIAILGAGVSGLSAAYYLRILGHEVAVFEKNTQCGGRLRNFEEDLLPKDVLETEVDSLLALDFSVFYGTEKNWENSGFWKRIHGDFDSILIASGPLSEENAKFLGIPREQSKIRVVPGTYQVLESDDFHFANVFAIGTAVRGEKAMIVRSAADAREVSEVIDRFVRDRSVRPISPLYSVRIKKMDGEQLQQLVPNGCEAPRKEPEDAGTDEFSLEEAAEQADRCLHCDCRGREQCKLLKYAKNYETRLDKYEDTHPIALKIQRSGQVIFEPGKCIKCGICITITKASAQPLGLSFVGRGFDVKIGVPFEETLETALGKLARECCEACPTAALVLQ